jgi:hypothetical protein
MHAWHRCCPNVSHLVALAPQAAAATFDLMILDPALGELLLPAGPLVKANPDRYDALRVLPARLALPGRRNASMGVLLELLPWSDHRSELTISCTANSRLPLGIGTTRYREAADAALDVLARLIESGTVRPNRRVPARAAHAAGRGPGITGPAVLTGPVPPRSTPDGERRAR